MQKKGLFYDNLVIAFIRLQSTACEQGRWNFILNNIDSNFLMSLALGYECIVMDYSSRYGGKRPSRAIWQGLEWIRYALNRSWFDRESLCIYGQHRHFKKIYDHGLKKATKRRLKYFKKFLMTEELNLHPPAYPQKTEHDGDIEYYREILNDYLTFRKLEEM